MLAQTSVPASAASDAVEAADMSRLVGGLGLLVGVVLILAIPLLLMARAASRRRRTAGTAARAGGAVDAWALAGRRMEPGS
jgi:hypothetical protein